MQQARALPGSTAGCSGERCWGSRAPPCCIPGERAARLGEPAGKLKGFVPAVREAKNRNNAGGINKKNTQSAEPKLSGSSTLREGRRGRCAGLGRAAGPASSGIRLFKDSSLGWCRPEADPTNGRFYPRESAPGKPLGFASPPNPPFPRLLGSGRDTAMGWACGTIQGQSRDNPAPELLLPQLLRARGREVNERN